MYRAVRTPTCCRDPRSHLKHRRLWAVRPPLLAGRRLAWRANRPPVRRQRPAAVPCPVAARWSTCSPVANRSREGAPQASISCAWLLRLYSAGRGRQFARSESFGGQDSHPARARPGRGLRTATSGSFSDRAVGQPGPSAELGPRVAGQLSHTGLALPCPGNRVPRSVPAPRRVESQRGCLLPPSGRTPAASPHLPRGGNPSSWTGRAAFQWCP